jgi:hypothetical protein
MSLTHDDDDAKTEFMKILEARALESRQRGWSRITTGYPGEEPLRQWGHAGIDVRKMPDDPQGILRISVGGGVEGMDIDYCTYRGDRMECIALLHRALRALEIVAGG